MNQAVHVVILVALAAAAASAKPAAAQSITADGTLGTIVSNGGPEYTISGGTVKNANGAVNLFHSFGQFNVPADGRATFTGDAATQNILSRVTGGSQSMIEGILNTRDAMPMANFFFMNPSGVVFTAGATIEVGGAFRVSTADNITLADGKVFAATPGPGDELLTSAPPRAFGFLGDAPRSISVEGAFLVVDPGQTLSLVGGGVHLLGGAILAAPGGIVQIASVASSGDVVLDGSALDMTSFSRLGDVSLSGGGITVGGDFGLPGGTIMIRSGQLVVDGAVLLSDTVDLHGAPTGLDLRVTGAVSLQNGALLHANSSGEGNASSIFIDAGTLTINGGSAIESQALFSTGNTGSISVQVGAANISEGAAIRTIANASSAGNITIAATGTVTVAGTGSEIASLTFSGDPSMTAGDILLTAQDMVLRDSGQIKSGDFSAQAAGVDIRVNGSMTITSLAGISSRAFSEDGGTVQISAPRLFMDAGFINASTVAAGDGGPIGINVGVLEMTNGAQIATSSQLIAPGNAGSIAINASNSVTVTGSAPDSSVADITFTGSRSSGIFSSTSGAGNAGQIALSTPTLTLAQGARISVATEDSGSAGTVLANAGSFTITGGARVDSSTSGGGKGGDVTVNGSLLITGTESGLFSTTSIGTGDAGAITVTGPALTVTDGGTIAVTTAGVGDAGTIVASVGNFNVTGGGRVDSSTTAGGAGGAITVNGTLAISGAGSGLFSTASGAGSAGAINATGPSVTVTGGGTIDSSTTGPGAGGAINVNASSQVEISGGGSVKADSLGAGNTGSITIAAGEGILMEAGSISTRAATSDGGNITLMAPNVIWLNNSQVTTSVQSGTGSGGNIFIDPEFVILQGTAITANAFGGPGGNITIVANNFLADATSSVQASSALSTPGSVEIRSPENNLASDLAQLPKEMVDASRLMQSACSARRAGASSSFTVAGRGGVPVDPDGYLPSYSMSEAPAAAAPRAGHGFMLAMAGSDCWR